MNKNLFLTNTTLLNISYSNLRLSAGLFTIIGLLFGVSAVPGFAQTVPSLGAAQSFAVLGGTTVTATGLAVISGNVGVSPGSAVTGFPPAVIQNGGIYTGVSVLAGAAQSSALTAYNDLKGQPSLPINDLSGKILGETPGFLSLNPGIYSFNSSAQLNATLTLNDGGDSNAVFIFQIGTTLTTASSSKVIMSSGGRGINVFWQIGSSATIGTFTNFRGHIIANTSITLTNGVFTTGRVFAINGAVTIDADTIDAVPFNTGKVIWDGEAGTSNWNDSLNWNFNVVPVASDDVLIPSGIPIYPVNDTINALHNICIQTGASLTVTGGILQFGGSISNSGTFDVSSGTIEVNGLSAQTIPANVFVDNSILNMIISNNVTLEGRQNLTGIVSFGNTNKTLYTGGFLTLKSTAAGTASLGDITGNYISGEVTIERYVPAKRAWYLLAVPIVPSGLLINNAWQEGVTTGNPSPGYGTHITGGTEANGFDQGINGKSSLKVYDYTINSFIGLPSIPGTNIAITNYPGYFLFIRGNRSTNLLQGVNAAVTSTVLRMKGQVNTGEIGVNIQPNNVTLVGNPYPSGIDFHAITKNNVRDKLYRWDPKLAGTYGVGGYVTLIWNSLTNDYDATTSVSGISRYIPSGEAFFVESLDASPATLVFHETNKYNIESEQTPGQLTNNENVRINLFAFNPDGSTSLSDGVLTTYSENNLNTVDYNDAKKINNIAENIGIRQDNKTLAIERRHTINGSDTTFLNLYNLKKQKYKLLVTAEAMQNSGLHAVVKDNYSDGIDNTAISLNGITTIIFSVTEDSASYASNRFSIVFTTPSVLPLTFTVVNAYRQQKDILVNWKTANGSNVKAYEVETSTSGISFIKAATILAGVNNEGGAAYSWLDVNVAEGLFYYRIKSTEFNGKEHYSLIVKVSNNNVSGRIVAYPNPLTDGVIHLQFNSMAKGKYSFRLLNTDGHVVLIKHINHDETNTIETIELSSNISKGMYNLEITKPDKRKTNISIANQ